MGIWQHCIQFGIDLRHAFSHFFHGIWHVLFDARGREWRRNVRRGERYIAKYTRAGKFAGLNELAGVVVDLETGEYVVGNSDLHAIDLFEAKYGRDRVCYVHSFSRKRV